MKQNLKFITTQQRNFWKITHFLVYRQFQHSFGQKFTFPIPTNRDHYKVGLFS